jgi:hypothetical protein
MRPFWNVFVVDGCLGLQCNCLSVLCMYCPGQQNVHSCCELDSETVVGVTCGELLAICGTVTLKGEVSVLHMIQLYFVNCVCSQNNYKL